MSSTDPPPGFLDAASGEPLHPAARAVLGALLGLGDGSPPDPAGWADPARRYGSGRRARILLDQARESVSGDLGCRPDEVSFTASGTQAVHLGIQGLLAGRRRVGAGLVCSAVEHSSVLAAARHAAPEATTVVPVDGLGRLDLDAWSAAVARSGTALACLQSANHEVGTVQPVRSAAAACSEAGVPLLVDAAQSVGRAVTGLELPGPGWAVLAASAHKWGGPPGVGVLAARSGARWRTPGPEDEREGGRVPGFPAVALAVAAAAALRSVTGDATAEDVRLAALVDRIRTTVAATVPDCQVLGDPVDRLPHVVTFSCLYVDGEAVLDELDRAGFAVSSGSSCTSSTLQPSHVLVAMGALAQGNIRVSLPRGVREADVGRFLTTLPDVVARVRSALGVEGL